MTLLEDVGSTVYFYHTRFELLLDFYSFRHRLLWRMTWSQQTQLDSRYHTASLIGKFASISQTGFFPLTIAFTFENWSDQIETFWRLFAQHKILDICTIWIISHQFVNKLQAIVIIASEIGWPISSIRFQYVWNPYTYRSVAMSDVTFFISILLTHLAVSTSRSTNIPNIQIHGVFFMSRMSEI